MIKSLATLLAVLLIAPSQLLAQGKGAQGGPAKPLGPAGADQISFPDTMDAALASAVQHNRVIIYYAYNGVDPRSLWIAPTLIQYIRGNAILLREAYSPDNELQRQLGIRGAPSFAAMDKYQNDLGMRMSMVPAVDKFMNFVRDAQGAVRNIEVQLKSMAKAEADYKAKGETAKAITEVNRILSFNKKGYPEIEAAKTEADSLVEAEIAKARVYLAQPETEKQGLQLLDNIRTVFRGLPQAMRGDLEAAPFLAKRGLIANAYAYLGRVTHADPKMYQSDIDKAKQISNDIVKEGIDAIRGALMVGVDGDLDSAREKVGKIQKDYSACAEVAKHASEVLSDLQK